ncbi:hypothetical protein Trydic_g943 [Trypoxylus dichotomus]
MQRAISKEEIIANVVAAIRHLPATEGDAVRTDVARILRTAKPQKSNISPAEWKALKQPKQDESFTIIQADKGNDTVMINTDEYKQKIKMLREPPTYITRQRDPTSSVLRETNKLVRAS